MNGNLAQQIAQLEKLRAEAAANRDAAMQAVEQLKQTSAATTSTKDKVQSSLDQAGTSADAIKRDMIASVVEMLASHVKDGDNADGLASLLAEAGAPGKQAESSGVASSRFQAPMSLQSSAATAAQHVSAEITLSGCQDVRKAAVVGLPPTHAGWEGASMGCDVRSVPDLQGPKSIVFVPTVAPGSLIRARVRAWQVQDSKGSGPPPARGTGELAALDGPGKWGEWARVPLPEGSFAALYRIGELGLLDRAGAPPADVDRLLLQSASAFSCAHEAQRQLASVMALRGSLLSPCAFGAPQTQPDSSSASRSSEHCPASGSGGVAPEHGSGQGLGISAGDAAACGGTLDVNRSHYDVCQVDWEEEWMMELVTHRKRARARARERERCQTKTSPGQQHPPESLPTEAVGWTSPGAGSSSSSPSSSSSSSVSKAPPAAPEPPASFHQYQGPSMLRADLRVPASSPGTYVVLFVVPEACDVRAKGDEAHPGRTGTASSESSGDPSHAMYTTADDRLRHGWRVAGASMPFEVVPAGASPQQAPDLSALVNHGGEPARDETIKLAGMATPAAVHPPALPESSPGATPAEFTLESRPLSQTFQLLVKLPRRSAEASLTDPENEPRVVVLGGTMAVSWKPARRGAGGFEARASLPPGCVVVTGADVNLSGARAPAPAPIDSQLKGMQIDRAGGFKPQVLGERPGPRWEALDAVGNVTDDLGAMHFVRVTGFFTRTDRDCKGNGERTPLQSQPAFVPLQFRGDDELADVATAASMGCIRCRMCGCSVMDEAEPCERATRLLAGSDTHDRTVITANTGHAADGRRLQPIESGESWERIGYGVASGASIEARGQSAAGAVVGMGATLGGGARTGATGSARGALVPSLSSGALAARPSAGALALSSDLGLSRRLGMWVCGGIEFSTPVADVSRSSAGGSSGSDDGDKPKDQPLAVLGLLATSARRGIVGVGQHELLVHPLDTARDSRLSDAGLAADGSADVMSTDPGSGMGGAPVGVLKSGGAEAKHGRNGRRLMLHPWSPPQEARSSGGARAVPPGQASKAASAATAPGASTAGEPGGALSPCWLRCGRCDAVLGHCLAPSQALGRHRQSLGSASSTRVPYRAMAETWLDAWQAGRQAGPEGEPAGLMPGGSAPLAGRLFKHSLVCAVQREGSSDVAPVWGDCFEAYQPETLVAAAAGAASQDPADDVARSVLAGAGYDSQEAAQRERSAVVAAVHADEGRLVPLADVLVTSGGCCITVEPARWQSAAPVGFRLLREWSKEVLPEVARGRLVFLPPADAHRIVGRLRAMASRYPPAVRRLAGGEAPPSAAADGDLPLDDDRGRPAGVWQRSMLPGQHFGMSASSGPAVL